VRPPGEAGAPLHVSLHATRKSAAKTDRIGFLRSMNARGCAWVFRELSAPAALARLRIAEFGAALGAQLADLVEALALAAIDTAGIVSTVGSIAAVGSVPAVGSIAAVTRGLPAEQILGDFFAAFRDVGSLIGRTCGARQTLALFLEFVAAGSRQRVFARLDLRIGRLRIAGAFRRAVARETVSAAAAEQGARITESTPSAPGRTRCLIMG